MDKEPSHMNSSSVNTLLAHKLTLVSEPDKEPLLLAGPVRLPVLLDGRPGAIRVSS